MRFEEYLSERKVMLAAILVFSALTIVLFMGLLVPLVTLITTGAKIGELGADYFNKRAAVPIAAIVILLGVCTMLRYFKARNVLIVVGTTIIISLMGAITSPFKNIYLDGTLPILVFASIAIGYKICRAINPKSMRATLRGVSPHLIHLGLVLILIGAMVSTTMVTEDSRVLRPGEQWDVGDYSIKMANLDYRYEGGPFGMYPASLYVTRATFDVYKNAKLIDHGAIEYITDFKWEQSYSTVYINRMIAEELFIAPKYMDTSVVNMYVRAVPMTNLIWGGIGMMVVGIAIITGMDYKRPKIRDVRKKYEERLRKELRRLRKGKK
ncbi:MAG: cytochrome c-type biogenesis CcmF C-terminal domain-containing protein [Methanocellales archaeon]|nr:cytochrome c-type biogenesis CcmF C-terminal domain-containing protein [Methanocellales archaeon]